MRLPYLLLALAIAAYAIYFSYLTVTRYAAFEARALDMGNLNQAIWNTMHGRWFHLTNQEGTVNRLSLHVEPILVPIAWLYRLYARPELLLVLQAVIVALGAIPLFALAQRKLANEWLALIFAVAFLLNPSIQAANWLEFHPITLAPTFLLAAFYCLLTGRTGAFALFAVLAASCKEEMALLVFMLGLYALVVLRRTRLGVFTMALSLLWAIVAVFYIQNTFAAGNIHWGRYAYLGESPAAMLANLATQPALIWAQLQRAQALHYLALLLLPVGFTGLLAPDLLFLALPSLAINLLADFAPMHQVTELIYAAPIVPFVMIAGVFGVARVLAQSGVPARRRLVAVAAGLVVAGGALASQRLYGYLPGGANHRLYAVTPHHRAAAALIAQIPPDARVSAQDKLNPHVSGREAVYIFPRIADADTVFLDVTGPAWPLHPNDVKATVDGLLAQGFGIAAADDGYLLLSKDAAPQTAQRTLPASFYAAWQRPGHVPQNPVSVDFGDRLRLIDYQVVTDAHGELVTQLYFQALRPLAAEADAQFYIAYLDEDGTPLYDTRFYPPVAALWYPTSRWDPETPVLVQTLPWTLDAEQFTLAVGLVDGEAGRLPVAASDPALPVLENGTLARLGAYRRTGNGEWTPVAAPDLQPARRMDARFGDDSSGGPVVLDGVTAAAEVVEPDGAFDFTLYWHAEAPVSRDYALFVHLLDDAGNKVAQLDWQPQDVAGRLPMTSWIAGQPVVDRQAMQLPAELAPGRYRGCSACTTGRMANVCRLWAPMPMGVTWSPSPTSR